MRYPQHKRLFNVFENHILSKYLLIQNEIRGDLYKSIRKHLQERPRRFTPGEGKQFNELIARIRTLKSTITLTSNPSSLHGSNTDNPYYLLCYIYANGHILDYIDFIEQGIPVMMDVDEDEE